MKRQDRAVDYTGIRAKKYILSGRVCLGGWMRGRLLWDVVLFLHVLLHHHRGVLCFEGLLVYRC